MATFELYRLILSPPTLAGPLLEEFHRIEPEGTRQEYLRAALSVRQDFFYQGKLMVYMPSPEVDPDGDIFFGFVGRKSAQQHGEGPERLFVETKSETWRASFFAVDISPNKQIAFFERRPDVGSGRGIFSSLFESVSKPRVGATWHVDVEYVWQEGDFWEAARRFRGQITELRFTFAPANGLRGFDEFKKFDQDAKEQVNAEVSDYSLRNSEGTIEPSGDFVESAVDYASEGAGEAVLKSGRKKLFTSGKSRKTHQVPESLMPRQREPTKILGLVSYLFGLLKGNKDD